MLEKRLERKKERKKKRKMHSDQLKKKKIEAQ